MIGHRIREARKQRGYNQQWLAEQIGVSQPSVSDWESGRNDPTMDNLAMAARVLDVHIEWLATGRGPRDYADMLGELACQEKTGEYNYSRKLQPPVPPSRQETQEFSRLLRRLQPEQRVLLLGVLRSLVDSEKTDGEKPAK
ncbi:DNA-binding XRE family transcriptional regulator [Rivihabitans pingtungensis]|uniref:DNA-binding XRE family transcriptional regulator n=4 Tax=Rivihabitans pingtungensis TaxID=1054498 RepID=A0A318KN42_9NEIS|nr:DNA-binding XRE family transcriptional regulator [Rivihabitans pingtungensis]